MTWMDEGHLAVSQAKRIQEGTGRSPSTLDDDTEDGHRLTLDDEEKATVFDIEGMLRIYGAHGERQDFPVPTRVDHPNVQTFNPNEENMRRFSWHWQHHMRCRPSVAQRPWQTR